MSRTRIVFFVVLALFLGLVAVALAIEIFDAQVARQIFVAATVFSVGVVLLDLLGVLGGHEGDAGHIDGHAAAFDHAGDDGDGADGGHGDDGDLGAGHEHAHAGDHAHAGHAAPVLSVLTYLRLLVYFCLGFGPTGWVSMASGWKPLLSLALATPVGLAAVFLAQAFFRFQRRDTDSQIGREELLTAEATVVVPLDHATMGKVRIKSGLNVTDRFALAAEPGKQFAKGEPVRIVQVTDECVYVR